MAKVYIICTTILLLLVSGCQSEIEPSVKPQAEESTPSPPPTFPLLIPTQRATLVPLAHVTEMVATLTALEREIAERGTLPSGTPFPNDLSVAPQHGSMRPILAGRSMNGLDISIPVEHIIDAGENAENGIDQLRLNGEVYVNGERIQPYYSESQVGYNIEVNGKPHEGYSTIAYHLSYDDLNVGVNHLLFHYDQPKKRTFTYEWAFIITGRIADVDERVFNDRLRAYHSATDNQVESVFPPFVHWVYPKPDSTVTTGEIEQESADLYIDLDPRNLIEQNKRWQGINDIVNRSELIINGIRVNPTFANGKSTYVFFYPQDSDERETVRIPSLISIFFDEVEVGSQHTLFRYVRSDGTHFVYEWSFTIME